MTYQQFFRAVCDLVRGLGVVVRTESFLAPDAPPEMAVYVSSDAHEVPVVFAGLSPVLTVAEATLHTRVDMALDALDGLVSGVSHLNHQQHAAYRRLQRSLAKAKPRARLLDA